jgi:hypothetical protein
MLDLHGPLPFREIMALVKLVDEKGYEFIGTNSFGNNAFFVRRDHMGAT